LGRHISRTGVQMWAAPPGSGRHRRNCRVPDRGWSHPGVRPGS